MNPGIPARHVAARASKPVLVITISVLLFEISAAQNPSVYQANAHPAATAAALTAGSSQSFNHHASTGESSTVADGDNGCTRLSATSYRLQVEQSGRSYAEQVEATSKLITDPIIAEYVNAIGQMLVRNSDAEVQVTLKIIDAEEVSAFSLPGGSVFIDSGLILATDNEAELAGVIAHEIAHLAACHAAQEIAREELTDAASTPLIFRIVFRRAIRNTIFLKPTRSFETEADSLSVQYLYKAGYDPAALPSFLAKIRTREKQQRRKSANALDVHPAMADRIKRTQQASNALVSAGSEYKLDTSEFQEIKKRLAELRNREVDKNESKGNPVLEGLSINFRP
jgi:beta-barrel assembly-enhancing protease